MLKCLEKVVKRTVVLHVDINRTIIMIDLAGGKTVDDVLNTNIAGRVYGRLTANGSFDVVEGRFDASPPSSDGLVSYDEYVDSSVTPPSGMETASAEERRAIWKKVTERRRAMLHSFTHPGNVGQDFASHIKLQRDAISYDPRWKILPSFFFMVNQLSTSGWPFVVVFRTFGNDLDSVLDEWKSFVAGEHFFKPAGDVLKAMRNAQRTPTCGALFRNELGVAVAWGRHTAIPPPVGLDSATIAPAEYVSRVVPDCTVHSVSFHSLFNEIMAKAGDGGGVLGLVDYYYFWSQCAEHRSAGKVFPILRGADCCVPYQVFFDDNLFIGDDSSIVDVRCAESGEPLCVDELAYCCGVSPYLAVVSESYFLDELLERIVKQDALLRY